MEQLTQSEIKALKELVKDKIHPEERYFKFVSQDGYSGWERKIYPESCIESYGSTVKRLAEVFPKDWQEVTKSEYIKQEYERVKEELFKEEERKPLFEFEMFKSEIINILDKYEIIINQKQS